MMFSRLSLLFGGVIVLFLSGCGGFDENRDLRDYIEETKRRPAGQIDPLPPFVPYQSFTYSAMTLRAPFDPPVDEVHEMVLGKRTGVKPDLNREKEYLEEFNIAGLSMVGTLERSGVLWALVDDGDGGIHRVAQGNYLGKNHGVIVAASSRQIEVVEIVPDGVGGWVERPQVLQIVEKD